MPAICKKLICKKKCRYALWTMISVQKVSETYMSQERQAEKQ